MATDLPLETTPHRRKNLLTGEWVLVSPHRNARPWQGQEESPVPAQRPQHDPNCYLCPGNARAGGKTNPDYTGTYVFDNDFAALLPDTAPGRWSDGLLEAEAEPGICRVICFSPDHSLTLPDMSLAAIGGVIRTWQAEFADLAAQPHISHVQIFENKGAAMGCSNPHPHGQVWAQATIPEVVRRMCATQEAHFQATGQSLLSTYLLHELAQKQRIVLENEHFVALVPFWAVWPFETMLLPRRHAPDILSLTGEEQAAFADILQGLTRKYDQLFQCSFPYSAGLRQRPVDAVDRSSWHWHLSFFPPLLRSATVRKFMVGYEMLAMPQRDITAEQAADRLRNLH